MNKLKKLLIISDTPMWLNDEGHVVVYEPTLREIEEVASLFEEVMWLGYHRKDYKFGSGRPSVISTIKFKMLLASGGEQWISKIKNLILLPYYFTIVAYYLVQNHYVHTRGPSMPAFIVVILSFVLRRKKYWNKYAGNWSSEHGPLFYKLQKRILLKAHFSKVTINGKWSDQLPHVLSFENPCFTENELFAARQSSLRKNFESPFTICFVGRLEEAKGVGNMLKAFSRLNEPSKVSVLILAGSGDLKSYYENMAQQSSIPSCFIGAVNRNELNAVYVQSHILLLPSRSEGFPKVLSEGIAFGCIPVVANVSALSQFINNGVNGFLLKDNSAETIKMTMDFVLNQVDLQQISNNACALADKFTYEKFIDRIRYEIFI